MEIEVRSKLYLGLFLALGIGIGLTLPSAVATMTGKHGHGSSGHGHVASNSQIDGEMRTQISRSGVLELNYPPELAIQLFTAEGEMYWLEDVGWNPAFLRGDGFNRNDVFAVGDNTFITVNYDGENGVAEYARVVPGKTAGLIEVRVRARGEGSTAEVTYNMASLGVEGDAALARVTVEAFADEMANWQAAIEANDDKIQEWLASRPGRDRSR